MGQKDDLNALVAEFMQVTDCSSRADAARHLASCGWRLDEALNLYYATVDGSSAAVRAPIPARSDTLYGASSSSAASLQPPAASPTGWERNEPAGKLVAAADHPRPSRRRRRRRRRDDHEGASADITVTAAPPAAITVNAAPPADTKVNAAPPSDTTVNAAPPAAKKRKTLEELYRPPVDLAYRGGFHEAKAHAAGLSRWLLVNVQATGEFASHEQNRDVWANDLVAQAVRDHFVLWQVDVHDERGYGGEGGKVCCYYKLAGDKMPVVLVVDPVTGQMMRKLRGATDPNDIIVMAESFADRRPVMPARAKKNLVSSSASSPPHGKQEPSKSLSSEKEPTRTARKTVAAAVAPMAPAGEEACKLRVRFPDGQVITKEFGAKCGVAALFAFCRSVVDGEEGAEEQPFRLMRFTGSSMQEISQQDVSFEDLGLHMSTVSMAFC